MESVTKWYLTRSLVLVSLLICCAVTAEACTGIALRTKDGAVIRGRSLEFGVSLESNIVVLPRGREYTGTTPDNQPGLRWKTKYGVVAANCFNMPHAVDGINEKGLYAGLFYFPGYAEYPDIDATNASQALAPWEFCTWLLTSFSSVAEAKAQIPKVKIGAVVLEQLGEAPPMHYILQDAKGDCIVVEPVDGTLRIHDNPLGVITNSPTFDWHITNLRNYVNLSPVNVPQVKISNLKIPPAGQGSGLLGLPGDYTPPSRFVRAVVFSQAAAQQATADKGVNMAAHIMNTFDIFDGAVVQKEKKGKHEDDTTQWVTIVDLKNKRFYFRTYDDLTLRLIDLSKLNVTDGKIKTLPMTGKQTIEDLTSRVP
jgi:choloylglycine hydrolase